MYRESIFAASSDCMYAIDTIERSYWGEFERMNEKE